MQKYIYERHPDWVVGSVISKREIYRKNKVSAVLFILKTSGLFFFTQMFKMKIMRVLLQKGTGIKPSFLAKTNNVKLHYSKNINSQKDLKVLSELAPDILISTNFSHFIGKKVRKISNYGAWNLHKAYLPMYRGMAPNFHALRESAGYVGATLHVVDDGFDTGPIIVQSKLKVENDDTVYSLNLKTSNEGGRILGEFLESCNLEKINPEPQPVGEWRNYSYPTREEITAFKLKGLKFE